MLGTREIFGQRRTQQAAVWLKKNKLKCEMFQGTKIDRFGERVARCLAVSSPLAAQAHRTRRQSLPCGEPEGARGITVSPHRCGRRKGGWLATSLAAEDSLRESCRLCARHLHPIPRTLRAPAGRHNEGCWRPGRLWLGGLAAGRDLPINRLVPRQKLINQI